MNIYDACLAAADFLESNPDEFVWMSCSIPKGKNCGTPGCALGWVSFFHQGELAEGYQLLPKAMGLRTELDFYHRMDLASGDSNWEKSVVAVIRGLRQYAEMFHAPAKVVQPPDWNAIAARHTIGENERSQELA